MRLGHLSRLLGPALASWLQATSLAAAEYSGRVSIGAYQSQERTTEESASSNSNDQQAYLARAYLDVLGMGPLRNQFVLDFRDKYDYFGQVDRDRLVLIEANEPQLRQLALKYPSGRRGIAWSLGRFPIADAGVMGNDGAEVSFKFTRSLRLGLFGGLIPQRPPADNLQPNLDATQGGIYAVYQTQARDWWDHNYFANALIAEQTLEDPLAIGLELEEGPDGTPIIPEPVADEEDEDEQVKEQVNAIHWYSSSVYQPSRATRITSLLYFYLTPKAYLRSGYLSWRQQVTNDLSGTLSGSRIDLSEYRRTRDVRETLTPSEFTQAKADVKQKLGKNFAVIAALSHGLRGFDGLTRTEGSAGAQASQLFGRHVSATLIGGLRNNFISRDTFVKAVGSFYFKSFDLSLDHQMITEKRDDGQIFHPQITGVNAGVLLGNSVLASAGFEYAQDERATITSGLVTIGYRFNSRQMTPVRDKAPPIDALTQ